MGEPAPERVAIELWIMLAAFVGAVWFLLGRRSRSPLWVAPIVAILPNAGGAILLSNADSTVAVFAATGALAMALWLGGGGVRYAVVGGVLLGAALNTKLEGTAFAAIVLAAAALPLVLSRDWRSLRGWAPAAVIVVAMAIPWQVWLMRTDPFPNQASARLGKELTLTYLADNTDRLDRGMLALVEQLANQGRWSWAVPAFIVLALASLRLPGLRRVAGFYLVAATLCVLAFGWVYWTNLWGDHAVFVEVTIDRVILTAAFVALVGLAHLIASLPPPGRPGTEASETRDASGLTPG
jgi:hypothetical protein